MFIRKSTVSDFAQIQHLYKTVASISGGIARKDHEVTEAYIKGFLSKSHTNGCSMVAEVNGEIIAEVHTYAYELECLRYNFGNTTICVHPNFQGRGIGKELFLTLLEHIENERTDILRVALQARESNPSAIGLYQKIGFKIEGRAEGGILDPDGSIVADVFMGWLNPNFSK